MFRFYWPICRLYIAMSRNVVPVTVQKCCTGDCPEMLFRWLSRNTVPVIVQKCCTGDCVEMLYRWLSRNAVPVTIQKCCSSDCPEMLYLQVTVQKCCTGDCPEMWYRWLSRNVVPVILAAALRHLGRIWTRWMALNWYEAKCIRSHAIDPDVASNRTSKEKMTLKNQSAVASD